MYNNKYMGYLKLFLLNFKQLIILSSHNNIIIARPCNPLKLRKYGKLL